jgi:hypothetical protein
MMKSIISVVTAVVLASALLSGCGGSGSDSSDSLPSGTYGTLTLAGSGSAVTGTTFTARTRLGISQSGMTVSQWYSIDLSAGTTYPYLVLIILQDTAGNVTAIDINQMTSETTASGEWAKGALTANEVSSTATAVTFTNLVVPGYGSSPTTSLTLNGSLRFQPG